MRRESAKKLNMVREWLARGPGSPIVRVCEVQSLSDETWYAEMREFDSARSQDTPIHFGYHTDADLVTAMFLAMEMLTTSRSGAI